MRSHQARGSAAPVPAAPGSAATAPARAVERLGDLGARCVSALRDGTSRSDPLWWGARYRGGGCKGLADLVGGTAG